MAAKIDENHVVVKLLVTSNDPSKLIDFVDEREFVLSSNRPSIAIGRSSKMVAKGFVPARDNCWFDSPVMSRNHATLSVDVGEKKITLVDEQSMHGTAVNYNETQLVPLHPHELQDGDRITFGQTVNRQNDQFAPTTVELAVNFVNPESVVRTFSPDAADALDADEDSQSLPQVGDDDAPNCLDTCNQRSYVDLTSPPPEAAPEDQTESQHAGDEDDVAAFEYSDDEDSHSYGESIDLSDDAESSLGSSLSEAIIIDDDDSDGSSGYASQDYYDRGDDRMWDYGEGWHESDNESDKQEVNRFGLAGSANLESLAESDERTFTLKSILNPTSEIPASPIQEPAIEAPVHSMTDTSCVSGALLENPAPFVPEALPETLAPIIPEISHPGSSSVLEPQNQMASVLDDTAPQNFMGRHTSVDFVSNPEELNSIHWTGERPQTHSVTEFEDRMLEAHRRRVAYTLRYWPSNSHLAQSGEAFLTKPLEYLPPRTEEEVPNDEDIAMTSAATFQKQSKKRKAVEISNVSEVVDVPDSTLHQVHAVQPQESEPRRIKPLGKKQSVRAMARAVAEKICYAAVGGAVITAGLIYTSPTFA